MPVGPTAPGPATPDLAPDDDAPEDDAAVDDAPADDVSDDDVRPGVAAPTDPSAAALISVVVPLFVARPEPSVLHPAFARFLDQFVDDPAAELVLSDSGPARPENPVADALAAEVRARPSLAGRVRYLYAARDDGPLSRGAAMNLGVEHSRGPILLFLHIDCALPGGALDAIRGAVAGGKEGGGFLKRYAGKSRFSPLHMTERYLNDVRTRRGLNLVGTNAIFLTRERARRHPYRGDFLEDVELSDWMRRALGPERMIVLPTRVTVSARKYQKGGVLPSIAINAAVMLLYRLLRVRPSLLRRRLYHRRFASGPAFWWEWLGTLLELLDEGGEGRGL